MNTVNEMWYSSNFDQILSNVFKCLNVVFCNILRGGGGNDLVKESKGKEGQYQN